MTSEATAIEVTLPAMGESVTEGVILEWRKQVGDVIDADDILVEVSTDKVDAEVPAPVGGTILSIHGAEGDTVAVGAILATIAPSNGASPAAEAPAPAEGPGPTCRGCARHGDDCGPGCRAARWWLALQ